MLIWQHRCENWVWNFAGYDWDPHLWDPDNPEEPAYADNQEACFQFNQLLSEPDWFYQEPNDVEGGDPCQTVYWLSIAAIYEDGAVPDYPWGWKTRPHFFNDDAVRIAAVSSGQWPPVRGDFVQSMEDARPVTGPFGESWDLAFELSTNEDAPEVPDTNAPQPDPPTWDLQPEAIASSVIRMTATTGSDPAGVEYYFQETSGNPGATDSGWISTSTYADSGLWPDTTYSYRLKLRDTLGNETAWSGSVPETTLPASADLYKDADNKVNFRDLAIMADQWLTAGP
jgi:hypothetical protein